MSDEEVKEVDLEEGRTVRSTLAEMGSYDEQRMTGKMEMNLFDGVRDSDGNPVQPVRLGLEDDFCFSCHKDVACWNKCCHGADITLTPGDILRLSRRLLLRPAEFLAKHTVPAMWEKAELPVVKLRMTGDDGKGPCVFMRESGCAVYKDRPETCRLYPLGLATAKMKHDAEKVDFHFLVKEAHCEGHDESKRQTVSAYRLEQGVGGNSEIDRAWVDILMKMVSWNVLGGVNGKPTPQPTKAMFFTVSTDPDTFRQFVFNTKFLDTYQVDEEVIDLLRTDDKVLMQLGLDWMKNVLFNEPTISLKPEILQAATARARETMGAM